MSNKSYPQPENVSERVVFEPFAVTVLDKPIRILPLGRFYRGDRVLDIDDKRAQEIMRNFDDGLPRYGVPVNVEHGADIAEPGSVGRVVKLEHRPGDGLYATQIEFTDTGDRLTREKRYAAPSPEIVWSLNGGARYQDPQTGKWHDNVLVGLALTNSPFFGREVSVFSAKAPTKKSPKNPTEKFQQFPGAPPAGVAPGLPPAAAPVPPAPTPGDAAQLAQPQDTGSMVAALLGKIQTALGAVFGAVQSDPSLAQSVGASLGGKEGEMPHKGMMGSEDEEEMMDEEEGAEGADEEYLDEEESSDEEEAAEGEEEGAEEEAPPKKKKPAFLASARTRKGVSMDVSMTPERFADLQSQVEKLSAERKQLAEMFAAERMVRRTQEFVALAESFSHIPGEPNELGARLLWLYDADATEKKENFNYFKTVLDAMNQVNRQSELFRAVGTAREGIGKTGSHAFVDAVEQLRVQKFAEKPYAEGFAMAWKASEQANPQLAREYAATQTHRARR